jgi:hypothetical protein
MVNKIVLIWLQLWEDLKMAGQDIIDLANNLSSLTETSYTKQVERERGSDDSEENLKVSILLLGYFFAFSVYVMPCLPFAQYYCTNI